MKKELEGEWMYHSTTRYKKTNNKYMKDYDKNKWSSYLKCWNVNNLHGWEVSQKLPTNDFKWVEYFSGWKEDFG